MGYTIFDCGIARLRFRAACGYIKKGAQICDIGCGLDGRFLTWLGSHIRFGVGVDIQLGHTKPSGVSIVQADITRGLPLRSGTFDHAVMLAVLEHLVDPAIILQEAFRILKPGGSLIISWPSLAVDPILSVLHRIAIVSDEMESQKHQSRIPPEILVALLRTIGFERCFHRMFEFRLNNLLVAHKGRG